MKIKDFFKKNGDKVVVVIMWLLATAMLAIHLLFGGVIGYAFIFVIAFGIKMLIASITGSMGFPWASYVAVIGIPMGIWYSWSRGKEGWVFIKELENYFTAKRP